MESKATAGGYIKLEDASYNWGFRLTAKKSATRHNQLNLQDEQSEKDVLSQINFELTPG